MKALTIVQPTNNIVEIADYRNLEVIEMIESLLKDAQAGIITGVSGIFTTRRNERGTYYAGECCKNPDQTVADLYALQDEILRR